MQHIDMTNLVNIYVCSSRVTNIDLYGDTVLFLNLTSELTIFLTIFLIKLMLVSAIEYFTERWYLVFDHSSYKYTLSIFVSRGNTQKLSIFNCTT